MGVIHCSQCGVEKRDVNHWYLVWLEWGRQRFCWIPWELDPAMAREETVQKLCGDQCLHKAVQKHADSLSGQLTGIAQ